MQTSRAAPPCLREIGCARTGVVVKEDGLVVGRAGLDLQLYHELVGGGTEGPAGSGGNNVQREGEREEQSSQCTDRLGVHTCTSAAMHAARMHMQAWASMRGACMAHSFLMHFCMSR
jgi:hypothetical protein